MRVVTSAPLTRPPPTPLPHRCDCGAQYLVEDVGARRRIAGERQHNEADKEHNKAIAEELAARGIARVLQPSRLHVAG